MIDDHLGRADQRLPGDHVQHRRAGAEHQKDRHAKCQQAEEQHQEQKGQHVGIYASGSNVSSPTRTSPCRCGKECAMVATEPAGWRYSPASHAPGCGLSSSYQDQNEIDNDTGGSDTAPPSTPHPRATRCSKSTSETRAPLNCVHPATATCRRSASRTRSCPSKTPTRQCNRRPQ